MNEDDLRSSEKNPSNEGSNGYEKGRIETQVFNARRKFNKARRIFPRGIRWKALQCYQEIPIDVQTTSEKEFIEQYIAL